MAVCADGCAELSLTVPITNSLAFLFTVLGEWWVEGKVISRGQSFFFDNRFSDARSLWLMLIRHVDWYGFCARWHRSVRPVEEHLSLYNRDSCGLNAIFPDLPPAHRGFLLRYTWQCPFLSCMVPPHLSYSTERFAASDQWTSDLHHSLPLNTTDDYVGARFDCGTGSQSEPHLPAWSLWVAGHT